MADRPPANVFVAYDADGAGRLVGQARLADDVAEIRRLSRALDRGNEVMQSWCLEQRGEWIESGGDEGLCQVSASALASLPKARETYQSVVGATISVGLGHTPSEASKALLSAKLRGKDRVVEYSPVVEAEVQAIRPQTEREKMADEDFASGLAKAGSAAGASISSPVQVTPDHSEGQQAAVSAGMADASSPGAPRRPPPSADDFAALADQSARRDSAERVDQSGALAQARSLVADSLRGVKGQLPVLAQIKSAAPDAYKSILALVSSVVALGRAVDGAGADVRKAMGPDAVQAPLVTPRILAVLRGLRREEPDPAAAPPAPVDLDKAGVSMIEPVGTAKDGKVKVQHWDGSMGWKGVRAGQILGKDPAAHAVSSREPGAR